MLSVFDDVSRETVLIEIPKNYTYDSLLLRHHCSLAKNRGTILKVNTPLRVVKHLISRQPSTFNIKWAKKMTLDEFFFGIIEFRINKVCYSQHEVRYSFYKGKEKYLEQIHDSFVFLRKTIQKGDGVIASSHYNFLKSKIEEYIINNISFTLFKKNYFVRSGVINYLDDDNFLDELNKFYLLCSSETRDEIFKNTPSLTWENWIKFCYKNKEKRSFLADMYYNNTPHSNFRSAFVKILTPKQQLLLNKLAIKNNEKRNKVKERH